MTEIDIYHKVIEGAGFTFQGEFSNASSDINYVKYSKWYRVGTHNTLEEVAIYFNHQTGKMTYFSITNNSFDDLQTPWTNHKEFLEYYKSEIRQYKLENLT